MFERFEDAPLDGILLIAELFRADACENKIDLGMGVYRDDAGETIVLPSVKAAETRLLNEQKTKSYVSPTGDAEFNTAMARVVLGDTLDSDLTALVQTPGGGSALRLLFEAVKAANPDATVWVPDPTWGNHVPIIEQVELDHARYPYCNRNMGAIDFDKMRTTLERIPAGDVVLLHGCCHNPTGTDAKTGEWDRIAEAASSRGWLPLVDIAYQGFARTLEEDAYGTRTLYEAVPEVVIAVSCSKNFAIYRERTGLAIAKSANASIARRTRSKLFHLARVNHSMPPDHGAAVVRLILSDPVLKARWEGEVARMRDRINGLRRKLGQALRVATDSSRFDMLEHHRGMFSLLGLEREQVFRLRNEHSIYMGNDSRINVAGLNDKTIPVFASAVADVVVA